MVPALIAAAMLLAACGGDDGDESSTAASSTTAEGPCPAESDLELSNSAAATGIDGDPVGRADGPIPVLTGFADVTLDENADLVFADYEIAPDPQFGLSAPVGDPGVPEGNLFFSISITMAGEGTLDTIEYRALDPGEGAVESPADLTDPNASIPDLDPHVNFTDLYVGSQRIIPLGSHTVTLTEITEQRLCGEITADTDANDLQVDGFPVVEGRFVIDRV
jgi:hypothetical protein